MYIIQFLMNCAVAFNCKSCDIHWKWNMKEYKIIKLYFNHSRMFAAQFNTVFLGDMLFVSCCDMVLII